MLQQSSSVCVCSNGGRSLLRWWANSANRRTILSAPAIAPTTAWSQQVSYSSARQVARYSSEKPATSRRSSILPTLRPTRSSRLAPTRRSEQAAAVPAPTPRLLEEADRRESAEDEAAGSTPAAIELQLRGLNALADALQADIAAHNVALQQHDAAASEQTIKRMKQRAATIRDSYVALIDTAFRAHKRVRTSQPSSGPSLSAQLVALERVWVDMCTYSQPTAEAFTRVLKAYGKEARRRRIRDLLERWLEDRDKFMQAHEKTGSKHSEAAPADEESKEVRAETERRHLLAQNSRRKREAAIGLPAYVSLYPAVRMDTWSYNVALSSYLSSLPLDQLTSESSQLSFPLSLLPRFKHDNFTIGTLMHAHGAMGEMPQVLQLVEQYKRMRREARQARGGARELQAVRQQNKKDLQYVYSTLLRALDTVKDVESAEKVWSEVQAKASAGQVEINRVMYSSMIAVYATANQHEKLRAISVEMSRAGLPMDEHAVCTVLRRLCASGHVADAIMLHARLAYGSMGPGAKQHALTYICLLKQLAQRPEVPFLTVAEVYRQGMESGLMWSSRSLPTSGTASASPASTWLADMRGVPLELLPVALHFHLSEMLSVYTASVRSGQKVVVPRQMLLLLGRHAKPGDASQQEEEADALDAARAVDAPESYRNGHRLSVGAIDWDEEEEETAAEAREEDSEARGDIADADEPPTSRRGRVNRSRVLIDPFATEEERGQLSQLDALKVQGPYVQRYVQHLLKQEWPSITAFAAHGRADKPADPASIDPSSPMLDSAPPPPSAQPPQLHVHRTQLSFWLAWHAHVAAAGGDDAALFPPPRTNGQSAKFASSIAQRIRERQQRLEAHQQRWERTKRGQAVAAAEGASGEKSLVEQLAEYKRREREALHVKARIFNTKRLPAAVTPTMSERQRQADSSRRVGSESKRSAASAANRSDEQRTRSRTAYDRGHQEQSRQSVGVESERSAVRSANTGTERRTRSPGTERPQRRQQAESDAGAATDTQSKASRGDRRSAARMRPGVLSSETLSSLLDVDKGLSPATKLTLLAMQQQQQPARAQKQAADAAE